VIRWFRHAFLSHFSPIKTITPSKTHIKNPTTLPRNGKEIPMAPRKWSRGILSMQQVAEEEISFQRK
jgi:hypothetical protein